MHVGGGEDLDGDASAAGEAQRQKEQEKGESSHAEPLSV